MKENNANTINVLLIEDKQEDLEFIELILTHVKDASFRLEWAPTLETGLKYLASEDHPFDVILLDLNLKESKGLETLSAIMSHMPMTPIVVLTGIQDEQLAIEAMRRGAQDYLMKGDINGKTLSRMMRYAIERKRASDLLNVSEDRFRQLIQTACVLVVCLSPANRILEFNEEAEHVFGISKSEVLGKVFFDLFVSENEREKFKNDINLVLNGKTIMRSEHIIHTTNGDERTLLCHISRISNPDGSVIGAMICSHDVTERARLESALSLKEHTYRALAKNYSNAYVFLMDTDELLLMVDGGALNGQQAKKDFFEGRKLSELLTLDELNRFKPHYHEALQGSDVTFEENYRGFHYRIRLFPIKNEESKVRRVLAIADMFPPAKN